MFQQKPQPFFQQQLGAPLVPPKPVRSPMAKMLAEDAGRPARNGFDAIGQFMSSIAAGQIEKKYEKEEQGRRSAMAQLLSGEDGKGVSIEEIERQAILAGDEDLLKIAKMRRDAEGAGGEFGLNMIWGTDADGNTVAFQANKGGGVRPVQFPKGVKPTPGMSFQDMGTYILPVNNKSGVAGAPMPKDVVGAETQKAEGKGRGEAKVNLPVVEGAANMMLSSIDSLINDPYLKNMVGPVAGKYLPNVTADSHRVQSKMDQIGGQSFLQAYNTLKGGGQITEVEGQKATAAINRLNAAQSYEDYVAALGELRDIVNGAVTRARTQAGGTASAGGDEGASGDAGGFTEGDYFDSEADIPEGGIVVDDDGSSFKKVNGKLVPVQ